MADKILCLWAASVAHFWHLKCAYLSQLYAAAWCCSDCWCCCCGCCRGCQIGIKLLTLVIIEMDTTRLQQQQQQRQRDALENWRRTAVEWTSSTARAHHKESKNIKTQTSWKCHHITFWAFSKRSISKIRRGFSRQTPIPSETCQVNEKKRRAEWGQGQRKESSRQSRHDQVTEEAAATTTILSAAQWSSSFLLRALLATIAAISTYVKLGN